MPTGDRGRIHLLGAMGIALCLVAGACKVEEKPNIQVDLMASKNPISPDESVQITALVTEDGNPLSGISVVMTVSPVGTFPSGNTVSTDAVGQAAAVLVVSSDQVESDTNTEVTATVVSEEIPYTGTLVIGVDVTAGGPR